MNLPGLTSRTDYRLSTRQIITVLWVGCLVYSTMIIALILLNRLGLPIDFSHLLHTIFVSCGVILLGWMGRTMTSRHFFFAQKRANSAASGWSGGTDWSGGAFLLILVSVSFYQRGIWIIAIMLGLLIMSLLFARAFHRAGVSTLPGFLAWRFPESGAGLLAIPASSIVLLLLAIAEFEVARSTMAIIDSVNAGQLTWFILFLAVVPAVLGGWMSLVFLNIVLALWLAISVLLPTLMLGLVPHIFTSDSASLGPDSILAALTPIVALDIPASGLMQTSIAVLVLAMGFATSPHALSRLSLVAKPVAAIEHVGWSALFVFIVLSAFGLSIELVSQSANAELATLLTTQPVLHVLPYFAILFAACNALPATLLALSAGIVRGVQRTRRIDPGERSMFGTRLCILAIAGAIGWWFRDANIDVGTYFVVALCFAAGTLFVPLLSTAWIKFLPGKSVTLAIAIGTFLMGAEVWHYIFHGPPTWFSSPVYAAMFSIGLGGICVLGGMVYQHRRPAEKTSDELQLLRSN